MYLSNLTSIWQTSVHGIIISNSDLIIKEANSAAEQLLDSPANSLKGKPLTMYLPKNKLAQSDEIKQAITEETVPVQAKMLRVCTLPINLTEKETGILVLLNDVTELEEVLKKLEDTEKWKNILTTILDTAYEGIIIVDEKGYITMFNEAYENFIGVKREEMIGRRVEEVIENTRLHIIVKTGKPEIRHIQRIKGHDMICDRIPIREGNKIIGAVGKVLFRDVSEIDQLQEQTRRLKQEIEYYKGRLRRQQRSAHYSIENIIGKSKVISNLKEMVNKVASSRSTVLLRGESGTGKELFAHAIHNLSPFYARPFIKVNCAAIPENLLESELFGYEEGAFTGAKKGGKMGKFEQAEGGSIFLDEIGDMPLSMQVKLLRVLQEREVERIGGTQTIKINARVIAATNIELEKLVRDGKFRQDLFYRLNVVSLEIPALRQRTGDIPVLIEHFLDKLGRVLGCGRKKISSDALEILLKHSWPGNIRELENVLERALNMVDGDEILPEHLPYYLIENSNGVPIMTLKEALAKTESEMLKNTLENTKGNVIEAAHLLGLSKSSFYEKMSRYGI